MTALRSLTCYSNFSDVSLTAKHTSKNITSVKKKNLFQLKIVTVIKGSFIMLKMIKFRNNANSYMCINYQLNKIISLFCFVAFSRNGA